MEFFGLNRYGVSSPIKDMMLPDYREPQNQADELRKRLEQVKDTSQRSEMYLMKELDCYMGLADGYSYGSWERLSRMRKKAILKPVGPHEMYRYPGVVSMDYGWWREEDGIEKQEWYKPRKRYPLTTSEMSRYSDHMLKSKCS